MKVTISKNQNILFSHSEIKQSHYSNIHSNTYTWIQCPNCQTIISYYQTIPTQIRQLNEINLIYDKSTNRISFNCKKCEKQLGIINNKIEAFESKITTISSSRIDFVMRDPIKIYKKKLGMQLRQNFNIKASEQISRYLYMLKEQNISKLQRLRRNIQSIAKQSYRMKRIVCALQRRERIYRVSSMPLLVENNNNQTFVSFLNKKNNTLAQLK